MDFMNPELIYEFHAKDLGLKYRNYTDQVVRDIRQQVGTDPDVHVRIEPEKKNSSLYSVAMSISGIGDTVFVKKAGKHIVPTLKKVKKLLLNKARRVQTKKVSKKRHQRIQKELLAS